MASTLGDLNLRQLLAGSYCSSDGVQPAVQDKVGNLSPKKPTISSIVLRPGRPGTDAYRLTSKDPGRDRQISEIRLLRPPQNESTFGSNKVLGLFKYLHMSEAFRRSNIHGSHQSP